MKHLPSSVEQRGQQVSSSDDAEDDTNQFVRIFAIFRLVLVDVLFGHWMDTMDISSASLDLGWSLLFMTWYFYALCKKWLEAGMITEESD